MLIFYRHRNTFSLNSYCYKNRQRTYSSVKEILKSEKQFPPLVIISRQCIYSLDRDSHQKRMASRNLSATHASYLSRSKVPCLLEYACLFQDYHQVLIYHHLLRGGRTRHTCIGRLLFLRVQQNHEQNPLG